MTIKFYKTAEKYGAFSNFSRHQFVEDEKVFRTSEHYFQCMKFVTTDEEYAEKIRVALTPAKCAKLGRSRDVPLREDWEEVKDGIMMDALRLKFTQHSELKELLLSTGDEEIIEDSPVDSYWGCGRDGKGKNMLGQLLMKLRDELA